MFLERPTCSTAPAGLFHHSRQIANGASRAPPRCNQPRKVPRTTPVRVLGSLQVGGVQGGRAAAAAAPATRGPVFPPVISPRTLPPCTSQLLSSAVNRTRHVMSGAAELTKAAAKGDVVRLWPGGRLGGRVGARLQEVAWWVPGAMLNSALHRDAPSPLPLHVATWLRLRRNPHGGQTHCPPARPCLVPTNTHPCLQRTVKRLLSSGTPPNAKGAHGNTALHLAAAEGHVNIIKALLVDPKAGVNLHAADGSTPLHRAAAAGHGAACAALLAGGAGADTLTPKRITPLLMAAEAGHGAACAALLEGGANPDLRNPAGASPIQVGKGGGGARMWG